MAKVPDEEDSEGSPSDEESDGCGRGWLAQFSTLKVGPQEVLDMQWAELMEQRGPWERNQLAHRGQSGWQEKNPKRGLNGIMSP